MEAESPGMAPASVVRQKRAWGTVLIALGAVAPFAAYLYGYLDSGPADDGWAGYFGFMMAATWGLAAGLALVIGGISLRRDAARLARQLAAEAGEPGPQGR